MIMIFLEKCADQISCEVLLYYYMSLRKFLSRSLALALPPGWFLNISIIKGV